MTAQRLRSQQAQTGQVLALGLLFAFLLSVLLVRFFYVGLINTEVVRQRHALDAATYSGALMQAQALNYASYLNRAYAGHQVAMAHLITMASWAHFAGTEAMRVDRGNPPASLIAMMFGPQHGAAYRAASVAAGQEVHALASGSLGRAFRQHDAFSSAVLQPASHAIYNQLPQWREQVIRQVLQDNYPDHDFSPQSQDTELLIRNDNWQAQIGWQEAQSLRPWLLQLVEHYDFIADRNHTARNSWVVDPRCPHKRHELRRRGETLLDEQGQWRAQDTQAYHALRSNRWIGCYYREYPMGWAWIPSQSTQQPSGNYSDEAPLDFSQQDFWRWVQENTNWNIFTGSGNPLSTSWARKDQVQWQGQGLSRYLDTLSPTSIVHFDTQLRLKGPREQWLLSTSSAESYFVRPTPRADQKTERNNLFHAFWQARLQQPDWRQRLQELVGAEQ